MTQHEETRARPARVECRAGHRADERPVAFEVDGRRREVAAELRAWVEPAGRRFVVRDREGGTWRLSLETAEDRWRAEPFSAAPAPTSAAG